jgi:hypothetical protein
MSADSPSVVRRFTSWSLSSLAAWYQRSPSIVVAVAAAVLSLLAFAWFSPYSLTNNYVNSISHINIARKIVDTSGSDLWQRYIQLGSPWLPLPHVLMLPFVANDFLWRSAVAGSIVSMLSYVAMAVAFYKLASLFYREEPQKPQLTLLSLSIVLLNPNLLYLQTTGFAELPYMATLVVSLYMLQRWALAPRASTLGAAGVLMSLATLTRYEAWSVLPFAALLVVWLSPERGLRRLKHGLVWGALAAMGPLYWLWHNWAIFGNPLEFQSGQFSSQSFNARVLTELNLEWVRDYLANPIISAAWMSVAAAVCLGPLVFGFGVVGLILLVKHRRGSIKPYLPSLLLFVPFAFHVYGMTRLEVLVQPLSQYELGNVRYGLSHVMAAALVLPLVVLAWQRRTRRNVFVIVGLTILLQYAFMLRSGPAGLPVDLDGAQKLRHRKVEDMARVKDFLRAHPADGQVLMCTTDLGAIVPQAGLTFSQIIHEGTTEWHEVERQLPPTVGMIVFSEGDWLWQKLREVRELDQQFQKAFATEIAPQFQVWVRKRN